MKIIKSVWLYFALVAASVFFLVIEHMTHVEFLLHMAAIPLEILLGALLVESYMARKEQAERKRNLMYIKSYVFRSEMRNLFIANFNALKFPAITMKRIKEADLASLRGMLEEAKWIEYKSPEAMEPVIMEYVKAHHVFHAFMERAINYNFEPIFHDMIYILHFIQDVKLFKEKYPERLFVHEAQKQLLLMEKVRKVLGDGIQKFLEYAIELKEKSPDVFYELMADYELSAELGGPSLKAPQPAMTQGGRI